MAAVHQFHQGIRRSDAISEEMLALRGILRGAGYDSEIHVGETIPPDLAGDVRPLHEYRPSAENLLLVHHSIGHAFAGPISALPDRRVLVYHNVTPPRFFAGNRFMQTFLRRGRRQLRFFAGVCAGAFADSGLNAEELGRNGFSDVVVVPPVFAAHRLNGTAAASARAPEPLVLFTGRLARNKGQLDLVAAFERFTARYAPAARLVLAGASDEGDPYVRELRARIAASPARERIETPGLVSDAELERLYGAAHVYVSLSEHEGFGVPLLEAFAAGLPVLAYGAGAVPETMGGGGVVFARKDLDAVAALMAEVVFDPGFRERLVRGQRARLAKPDIADAGPRFLRHVERWLPARRPAARARASLAIRVEGPFETTYGLAVANRRMAEALERFTPHRVSIHCTEGPGDYLPRQSDLVGRPLAARLFARSLDRRAPDVAIRNMYPPRFERGDARVQLAYVFWEDSLLPPGWAEDFTSFYDGLLAPSRYVAEILERSGVGIPVEVVPTVVDPLDGLDREEPVPLRPANRVRFLSVGSAFPRKGTDLLIRAFARAFRASDPVTLVLKTFPNPHNTVGDQLRALREADPGAPEILHLDRDLSQAELVSLFRSCDALVHPARAEGFGLPPAEAMALGLPVIAPSATALADFCTEETCLVVPHRMVSSASHFHVPGARWAEPDEDALVGILRGFADGSLRTEAVRRARRGAALMRARYAPEPVARRIAEAVERLAERARAPRVALVSTWNTQCGIAAYSRDLLDAAPRGTLSATVLGNADAEPLRPDGPEVARPWLQAAGVYEPVVGEALEAGAEVVHVQFHPGLFAEYDAFSRTLEGLHDRGVPVVVTVHLVEAVNFHGRRMLPEALVRGLSRCARILVHAEQDRARLVELGLGDVVEKIAIGSRPVPVRERRALARDLGLADRRVIAQFGFALPHKGVLEAIEAVPLLRRRFPDLLFLVLSARRPEPESAAYVERCRARIAELGVGSSVVLIDRYLAEDELFTLLGAAEVVVLPYHATLETASAAVRYPLACGRATVTTRERIFDGVREAVFRIPDPRPGSIARAVERLLSDHALRASYEEKAARVARESAWPRVAERHVALYREILWNDRRLAGP